MGAQPSRRATRIVRPAAARNSKTTAIAAQPLSRADLAPRHPIRIQTKRRAPQKTIPNHDEMKDTLNEPIRPRRKKSIIAAQPSTMNRRFLSVDIYGRREPTPEHSTLNRVSDAGVVNGTRPRYAENAKGPRKWPRMFWLVRALPAGSVCNRRSART